MRSNKRSSIVSGESKISRGLRRNSSFGKSKVLSHPVEDAGGDQEPDIAECDEFYIFRLKQRTRWVKVVDAIIEAILLPFSAPFALSLMEIMPGHIRDQVGGPATKLLVDKVEDSNEGCLFGKLVELMQKVAVRLFLWGSVWSRWMNLFCLPEKKWVSICTQGPSCRQRPPRLLVPT
jgi:hypothetical protein